MGSSDDGLAKTGRRSSTSQLGPITFVNLHRQAAQASEDGWLADWAGRGVLPVYFPMQKTPTIQ